MRLSEAIRLGALLRPQAWFVHFSKEGGSCATGAAMEAIGIEPVVPMVTDADLLNSNPIFRAWHSNPVYRKRYDLCCPVCGDACEGATAIGGKVDSKGGLSAIIIHLNNYHWTREQIADWVEALEQAGPPTPSCAAEMAGAA